MTSQTTIAEADAIAARFPASTGVRQIAARTAWQPCGMINGQRWCYRDWGQGQANWLQPTISSAPHPVRDVM